jgi:Xaa-Pro aminopeptidase
VFYNENRLVDKMKQYDLDAIVVSTKENIRYFTGFEPVIKTLSPYLGECYIVITRDKPNQVNIVHSVGEIDQVLDAKVAIGKVQTYGTFYREYMNGVELTHEERRLKELSDLTHSATSAREALSSLLRELGLAKSRLGIDEDGMTMACLSHIKSRFPGIEFIFFSNKIRQIRAVKTPHEIDALTYAANCVEKAIEDVISNLKEGISELEIANMFNTSIASQGAIAALPMIKIGRHAVGGQRRQKSEIKLQPGDLIWFDCDVVCNGYWADNARVFSYKYMKPEYDKFNALYKGQLVAINEVKIGMKGKDVFKLTMSAGLKKFP